MIKQVPVQVVSVLKNLEQSGFEAFIVGGCVRDLLQGATCGEPVEPKDWDVATNAKPEEVQKIFSAFAGATADKRCS